MRINYWRSGDGHYIVTCSPFCTRLVKQLFAVFAYCMDSRRICIAIPHTLLYLVPPQVRAKSSYLNVHVPQKARLACECSGIPELKVTWFKDGVAVEGQGQVTIKGCQLTIWQVAAVDAGFYQCRAENGAGMAQATAQLVVAPLGEWGNTIYLPWTWADYFRSVISLFLV